jgi:hypothetical protein
MFNENVRSQNCGTQYNWFESALLGVPKSDWLIVVGHHPIDELDVKDFATLLQQHGFGVYLNGHVHTLNRYTIDGSGAYITSGAGALVDTPDQYQDITMAKLRGERQIGARMLQDGSGLLGHTYETVVNAEVAGFVLNTFSSDFSYITNEFVKYNGDVVYSFNVWKNGTIKE